MGEIGRAMLRAGLVSEERLQKAEREVAEKIINKWKEKYGSDFFSQLLFIDAFTFGGLAEVKRRINEK